MDGVLYRGDTPIPDAVSALARLQADGRKVYLLTNNSGSSRQQYVDKLAAMGYSVPISNIFTSAYAAAIYLSANHGSGKNVFIIGQSGIAEELSAVGMNVFVRPDEVPCTQIDYVVVGIDRAFTYDKLRFAHACIVRGHAQFVATNCDATYPVENGTIPGAGSIVASVATATGRQPLVIGKPEPHALEAILRVAGDTPDQTLMTGDRLDTDIAAGNRVGSHTALVLTGVTTRQEAETATGDLKPDKIIGTLLELLET